MELVLREKRFPSATGLCDCRYRVWQPAEVRGAVQLTHGMAEHIDRYDEFARYLAGEGFLVYGMDNPGHGKSIGKDMPLGFFGDENGWRNLILDMRTLYNRMKADYPATAFILFGHSMGSFMARSYSARFPGDFEAYVFSGTAGKNPVAKLGRFLANREIKKGLGRQPSLSLHKMSVGGYNKKFKNAKTPNDWLTRDEAIVSRYEADEKCGFPFTACGMRDMLDGLIEVSDKGWAKAVPKKPILLIAGDHDPVGSFGKGVLQVKNRLEASGHEVCCKLYENGRHEMLNELNRDEVFGDVLLFLETVTAMGEIE
ncbi:MAG: alpha/beta fold hydrolase [Clostridia bacterium]|nr:alpha/beta fold hydrolase [Clostridia bacterium]